MTLQRLRKLYNSFPVKDMSFENFCKEFMVAVSPPTPQELTAAQLARTKILMN